MAIEARLANDDGAEVFVPVLLCDTCEEPITDIDDAMYAFNSNPDKGDRKARFAHKGRCLTRVETEIRVAGGLAATDDLRRFLTFLANSMNPAWPERSFTLAEDE